MQRKYKQIAEDIQQQISEGVLVARSKLPSVRSIADQYSCSKNTVIKAYEELEKAHFIYAIPKSGYYVVDVFEQTVEAEGIDFLSAGPDQSAMPYVDFQHCLNKAIEKYKEELFTYADPQGLYPLRQQVVKYLQNLQVFTEPERIVVVSGSQQALHLLAAMPFPNGKNHILLEQPTYFGLVETVQLQGITTFGIELTMDGIDLERLEYIFRNNDIKFFYIIPRFHNPLGHSYSNSVKQKIVELAQRYDVYIVEDDFLGELDSNTKSDPLFAYAPSGRVIYIKSFSKIFLPGLRLATVVVPPMMLHHFLRYKFSSDFNSSTLSQGALEIYMKSGMFDSHIKSVKEIYQDKMQQLLQACQVWLPPFVSYTEPTSGFYMSIYLPENMAAKQVLHLLSEEHIEMDDASRMFLPEYRQENMIRISISQVDMKQIPYGIERLAHCITTVYEQKKPARANFVWW